MKKIFFSTLYRQILILTLGSVLFVAISLTSMYIFINNGVIKHFIDSKNKQALNNIEKLISLPLLEQNYVMILNIIDNFARTQQIKNVWITDKNGSILVSTNPKELHKKIEDEFKNDPAFLSIILPQDKSLSMLSNYDLIKEIQEKVLNAVIISLIVAMLGLIVVTMFFSNKITQPIKNLIHASTQISLGNYNIEIQENRQDEFKQLGETFNQMAKTIKYNTETLEYKVKQRTLDLEQANNKLLQMDKVKTDFLSTVSHELRTPLTSVLGFIKIISRKFKELMEEQIVSPTAENKKKSEQIEHNIQIILSEGNRLTNLINDVLDISKMEAGRIEWQMKPNSIYFIIEHAIMATATLFQEKNIELIKNYNKELPEIYGDRDRLIQLLINLLSNAIKFTNKGSITCSAKQVDKEIIVQIIDTGIGIAPEDQPKVFEKFKQVGDTLTDKPKGTGLGLPICKQIIEHHRGKLWVESILGEGSTFSFSLNIASNKITLKNLESMAKNIREHIVSSSDSINNDQKTILVIDDDKHIREYLRQELSEEGYKIIEADNGKEGVTIAQNYKPDLIILDVMMPEMNGFDVALVLKKDKQTYNIPIVILSIVEDPERGYNLGVDRYFTKPINIDTLLKEVNTLTSRQSIHNRVLLFVDNEELANKLNDLLAKQGFQIIRSSNLENTFNTVKSFLPDMVVADATLQDSYKLISTIKQEKGLENIFFLLLGEV